VTKNAHIYVIERPLMFAICAAPAPPSRRVL